MRLIHKRLILVGVVLAIVAAALAVRRNTGTLSSGSAQSAGPRALFTEGTKLLYALSWTASTRGSIAPGQAGATSMSMETDVEADVSVTALGERGSGEQLAFTCDKIRRFHFRMQEQDVALDEAKTAAELEGQSAYVTVDSRGQVRGIGYSSAATPPARSFLRAVVQQMQVTLASDYAKEWDATETTTLGTAKAHYLRDGSQLSRKRVAYERLEALQGEPLDGAQELHGSAALQLDSNELLISVRETESFRYARPGSAIPDLDADWSFTAQRKGEERADPRVHRVAMSAAPVQAITEKVKDPGFEARREAQLAKDMSEARLLNEVDKHQSGSKPSHDFMVKAGAFLRLHPEVDQALLSDFRVEDRNVKGRGFILDMLAQAGDQPAQKAMLDALASPQAHAKDKDFSMLVQRFTFVAVPTPEAAEYLARIYAESAKTSVPDAQGAATALGATVNHLQLSGQASLAREYNGRLRDELAHAGTPDLQRGLLAGLGNARREENVPVIAALADSKEPLVRAQVASSLRNAPCDEGRHTLLALAGDYDAAVALTAFASLRGQTLAAEDWTKLRGLVDGKTMNTSADLPLVQLIRDHRAAAGDEGAAMLQALLARNGGGENDVGTLIRDMLEHADASSH